MNAPFEIEAMMPPPARLDMPAQDVTRRFVDPAGHGGGHAPWLARLAVFGLSAALTAALALVFEDWFMDGGINVVEGTMIALVVVTFYWIALSLASALLGLLPVRREAKGNTPLDVAILMPVFGEPVADMAARWQAMLDDFDRTDTAHRYALFVLSDTRDESFAQQEQAAILNLRTRYPDRPIYYRRRADNEGFKAGNIADWVRNWGGAYEVMIVLDADSVMSAKAVGALADAMSANPAVGLIQSVPRLYGSRTIFARAQQFANTVYGPTLARGLAHWSGDDANYWGHNAIIRTKAFAASAGLPCLAGRAPFGGPVLSHDFVEAALLRRAGWRVRFMPCLTETYETTPPSLIAHLIRDRRWCQGNLQHLRLLTVPGLRTVSRLHLFQGAMAYMVSLGWFGLLVLWVLLGLGAMPEVSYFSEDQPLTAIWPQMDRVAKALILGIVYGLLIAPKLIGALRYWWSDPRLEGSGGITRFWISWLVEVVLSILLAPSLMIQHIIAVARTFLGLQTGWRPLQTASPRLAAVFRYHAPELIIGTAMFALYMQGLMHVWLLPIAACLVAAPVLSALTATTPRWAQALLQTPQDVAGPDVLRDLQPTTPTAAAHPQRKPSVPASV